MNASALRFRMAHPGRKDIPVDATTPPSAPERTSRRVHPPVSLAVPRVRNGSPPPLPEQVSKTFLPFQGKKEQGYKSRIVHSVFFMPAHGLLNPGHCLLRPLPPGTESQNPPTKGQRRSQPLDLRSKIPHAFFNLPLRDITGQGTECDAGAVRLRIRLLPVHEGVPDVPSTRGQLSIHQQADSLSHTIVPSETGDPQGKDGQGGGLHPGMGIFGPRPARDRGVVRQGGTVFLHPMLP